MSRAQNGGEPGCLRQLAVGFVGLTIIGVVVSVLLMVQPQQMDDILGLEDAPPTGVRDVEVVLRESVERRISATITEAEINQWLAKRLEIKQGGKLADHVTFERVAVRLSEGMAEIVMVREIKGRPFTISMFLMIDQTMNENKLRTELNLHGGRYATWLPKPPRGGRFGKLVVPQGFLRIVMPSFENLAEAIQDEITDGFKRMAYIKIEEDKLLLDPRPPRKGSVQE